MKTLAKQTISYFKIMGTNSNKCIWTLPTMLGNVILMSYSKQLTKNNIPSNKSSKRSENPLWGQT